MPNPTHIIPVLVGDPVQAKRASDMLLQKHGIYVQAINFPTVAQGTERLRISSSARYQPNHEEHLVAALEYVRTELCLNRVEDWEAKGGRAGVGSKTEGRSHVKIWSEQQLCVDGTT